MRAYRHILLTMCLTSVINGMLYPIMALYIYNISQDYFMVGLVNSAISTGAAIGSLTAGYLLSKGMVANTFFPAACVAAVGLGVALM